MKPYYKYEIPEGYEARIEENNVIIQPKQSENERIRKEIIRLIQNGGYVSAKVKEEMLSYLENLKEQKPNVEYVYPKFRVGDEIVEVSPNGSCCPVIIKYIGEGGYYCESKDRKRFLSFPIKQENEYRLIEHKPTDWIKNITKD